MQIRRALFTLFLCIALLAIRMGSAHLHLCLDGSEPPVSIQYDNDMMALGHAESGPTHQDYDYDLSNGTMGKLPQLNFWLISCYFFAAVWLLAWRRTFAIRWRPVLRAPYLSPHDLRPPPCGPPVTSYA